MIRDRAPNAFSAGVAGWLDSLGQLRDVVRQEVLAAQLSELAAITGAAPLRVLDIGCGQGTQAMRLARAGHEVIGLDPSQDLLDHFGRDLAGEVEAVRGHVHLVCGAGEDAPDLVGSGFDLVLCHGVLMYLDDPTLMLAAVIGCVADDGRVSLLVRNGLAPAMRAGLRGDWAAANAAFDTLDYTNGLGLAARAHTPAQLDAPMQALGWARRQWYGVRVFTDHRGDEPAPQGERLSALLAAERTAAVRDPYRHVAALLHLVYGRAQPPISSA
ncbi:MAG: methyltransferase [Pseudonocardiales bacterium]